MSVPVKTSAWHAMVRHLRKLLRAFEAERSDDSSTWQVRIRLQRDDLDGGWVAECVEMPGVFSQGETQDEAVKNVLDALGEAVATRMSEHIPTLKPEDEAPESSEMALSV